MGVRCDFYRVDWKELRDRYLRERSTEFLFDALEDEEPWLEAIRIQGGRPDLFTNFGANVDFTDIFNDLAATGELVGAEGALRTFCESVGCLQDAEQRLRPVQELIAGEDEWVFAAMSPASVSRLSLASRGLSFESHRTRLDELIRRRRDVVFKNGHQLQRYLEEWQRILGAVERSGGGLLILAA